MDFCVESCVVVSVDVAVLVFPNPAKALVGATVSFVAVSIVGLAWSNFDNTVFAVVKCLYASTLSNVSQNSSLAVPCKSLRTRVGLSTPGNSTSILPLFSNFCMFGCVTPNLSIRARKI